MTDYKIGIDSIYTYSPGNSGTRMYKDHTFTFQSSGQYTVSLPANPFTVNAYHANIRNATDYYPFGMMIPWRYDQNQDGDYNDSPDIPMSLGEHRWGFQGGEMDNEIKGLGNSYKTEFRQYDSRIGRWLSLDPLALSQPGYSPYKAFYNNPIFWTDKTGGTEEERLAAILFARKNIGKKYGEAVPGGGNFDCSGLVRNSMMQSKTISDPYIGHSGNGVSRIIAGSTQIKSVNDIEVGNVVVIKSGGNANGHIMLITEITKENGKVISYKVVHAEAYWENEKLGLSGGGNVNETTIHTDGVNRKGETYSKRKYEHRFYKWDTPDKATPKSNTNNEETKTSTTTPLSKDSSVNSNTQEVSD